MSRQFILNLCLWGIIGLGFIGVSRVIMWWNTPLEDYGREYRRYLLIRGHSRELHRRKVLFRTRVQVRLAQDLPPEYDSNDSNNETLPPYRLTQERQPAKSFLASSPILDPSSENFSPAESPSTSMV